MRSGVSDEHLGRVMETAVWRKEEGHIINQPGFIKPAKNMSARAISWNRTACSVSSEMLMRFRPASASFCALSRSSTPLVVMVMSSVGSIALIMPTSSSTLIRTSGSPPVMRIVRTP